MMKMIGRTGEAEVGTGIVVIVMREIEEGGGSNQLKIVSLRESIVEIARKNHLLG